MNKLLAFWELFKVGASVADTEKWKKHQITATVVGTLILAVVNLLAAFGYSLPISPETANMIAGGIVAVVNVVLTITTTDKIGLPAKEIPILTEEVKEVPTADEKVTSNSDDLYRG